MRENSLSYDFSDEFIKFTDYVKSADFDIPDPAFPSLGFRNKRGDLSFPSLGFKMETSRGKSEALNLTLAWDKEIAVSSNQGVDPLEWIGRKPKYYGKSVKIAVIDSGCNSTESYNFVASSSSSADEIQKGHGTHVKWIIQRISPHAEVINAKVADGNGSVNLSRVICALIWAATKKAHIANLSLSLTMPVNAEAISVYKNLLGRLFYDKNLLVFCGIGKRSVERADSRNKVQPINRFSILAYSDYCVKVSAVNKDGVSIYNPTIKTYPVNCAGLYYVQTPSRTFDGYSAACPVASAAYALFLEKNKGDFYRALSEFYKCCQNPAFGVGRGFVRSP